MRVEINKVVGPERVECCRQSTGIVLGAKEEAITAGAHPLATCSLPSPAGIITFFSVILHYGSLHIDNGNSREAPSSGSPPDAPKKRERERE